MLQFIHLYVVRSQDDPAAETISQIDDSHTQAKANHIGQSCSKCDDQDLCGRETRVIIQTYYTNLLTSFQSSELHCGCLNTLVFFHLRCISERM